MKKFKKFRDDQLDLSNIHNKIDYHKKQWVKAISQRDHPTAAYHSVEYNKAQEELKKTM